MKSKTETFDWQSRINVDPGVAAGRPVITGTRVPVEVIVGSLGGGATIREVCADYNLSEEDVRAALIYAAEIIAARPPI